MIQITEIVSIGMMINLFGLTLTAGIIGIMMTSAIVGHCIRGVKILPQIFGLLTLGFVVAGLEKIPWIVSS